MDIERLKELKAELEKVRKYNDMHCMSTVTEDDVLKLIDEATTNQPVTKSATSEEVQRAIKRFQKRSNNARAIQDNGDFGCVDMETWEKYQRTIEDCDLAITALQAYQPWIPVSERLPTDGDEVICFDLKLGVMQADYTNGTWWLDNDSWTAEHVTHWMPLPQPPKGE